MNYLSPFHILPKGFETKSLIDKKSLKKARKIVLAEFELQGKTTIFINEQEYDKNDVLKFFDDLEKDTNLELHALIYQTKPLLHFLETGNIEYYEETAQFLNQKKQSSESSKFILFVSNYFTNHYNQLLYNALRNNNDDLFILIETKFPLPQQYEASAYQTAYRWYHQQLRTIETIEEELQKGQFVAGTEIYELIEPGFIHNFNQMPMYFFDVRDQYAFRLYELIVLLNNKYKRSELARSVLDAGILLDVEDRTHQYFINADEIIDKKKEAKSKFNWVWVYLIGQLIFIIFKMATCNNTSTSSDYQNINTHNTFKSLTNEEIGVPDMTPLDSIRNELNKESD